MPKVGKGNQLSVNNKELLKAYTIGKQNLASVVKIQAHARGFLVRKKLSKKNKQEVSELEQKMISSARSNRNKFRGGGGLGERQGDSSRNGLVYARQL